MDWSVSLPLILGAALAISEALALWPAVQSNSIFQVVVNVLKSLAGKNQ